MFVESQCPPDHDDARKAAAWSRFGAGGMFVSPNARQITTTFRKAAAWSRFGAGGMFVSPNARQITMLPIERFLAPGAGGPSAKFAVLSMTR